MAYTDDPILDFDRWDRECQKRLAKLPICCRCCEPIQDDTLWVFNDLFFCEECATEYFRHDTEDYIEE